MQRFVTKVVNRRLLKIQPGNVSNPISDQVRTFLQGLITNDIKHLDQNEGPHSPRSMFTMFLNPKGRILYDSIIYSTSQPETFFVECDEGVSSKLQRHLNMFKVRRDIRIEVAEESIWILYEDHNGNEPIDIKSSFDHLHLYDDPRLRQLGKRIVAPGTISDRELLKTLNVENSQFVDPNEFRELRYKLGVGEGVAEIPMENSFPLEANCDYLHGVSFQKGCYIGQELTARTHHTGVVRKRLMPLFFENQIDKPIPNDTPIYSSDNDKTSIGKLRGFSRNVGIALLRINEALAAPSLNIMGNRVTTIRPKWWPVEAPKEKLGTSQ
jgi:transferase CAF17, mitochondrial